VTAIGARWWGDGDGCCGVDTPGIRFQGGPWPYFTTDWNIERALWPVYTANRLEQGQALVDRLYDRRDELIKAVRPVEWQKDSAYLPLAVAWDMRGSREGDMRYYDLVGDLAWALNNCWSQYRYSMDDAMLREKIYPLHLVNIEQPGAADVLRRSFDRARGNA